MGERHLYLKLHSGEFNTGVIQGDISEQSYISKRRRRADYIYHFMILYAEPGRS